jgi:hypothetical protein
MSAGPDTGASAKVLGVAVGAPDEVLQLAHTTPFLTRPNGYRITEDLAANKRFRKIGTAM